MSNVVKGTRGTGRLRAAVNLTLGCVLLGGCSAGSDRFSSVSFGSGYGAQPRVSEAAAPSRRIADNYRQPAQTPPSYYQAQPASYRPQTPVQPAGGYQLASAAPSQTGGYLQASRVDLPPLPQRQPAQGTKMADGYGPYNQPPLPDGTYSGPRVFNPYEGPRGDAPPAGVYVPQGGDPRGYGRDAPPPPPPPSDFYRRSDAPPPPLYPPRDETRVYEPAPVRPYAGEPAYNGGERSAYGRAPEGDGYAARRPWSGRTDGEMVAVAPGDTLPTLARRYGVTVDMIARANGLSTVYVRPGTKLFIPRADPASYAQGSSRVPAKAAQAAPAPAGKDQSRPAIASSVEKPNRNAPAGQELKAPAAGSTRLADKGPQPGPQQAPAAVQPAPINSAGLTPSAEASCEAALSNPQPRMGATFRKPVDGKTISPFGPQKDGTVNEGITISVPKGTPVKAAENGVVAYVGDELPGFGNLILIRHADEYVTAYAHADTVLVKKCDVVKRGQTVATAGTTGDTSQPQVHFEIRKNSKPVDPSPLLGS
jgi:murein DD-endopeptidase MepM/ murein hydrolase activator NlpD